MISFSQSINFDQLGKEKWLRYNGGIVANMVYYDGAANRQPWTYYLSGNLNFNISGIYNIPFSFTYSNQDFHFTNPFKFNRLSLHPSYKWATVHIGDVSMAFSPYTLAGFQFTGIGIELAPEGPFKVSAMYGRLLKATEYDPATPQALVAYKRMGYGLKTSYEFEKIKLGLIFFKANDRINSLVNPFPVELELAPKDNVVVSLESGFELFQTASFRVEYAVSGITEDMRLTEAKSQNGSLGFILNENISSNYYKALNASFIYPAGNGTLGAGYERIDPGYRTLGAYYFNNDLENITINASQTIFDNRLTINVNGGLQQDNLNKEKSSDQQRIVSSINLNYSASERLGFNGSYSNFQSYTNIKDQFDYINQVNQFDNIDTLNYRQISQNANLGINYIFKKTEFKQHSANLNLIYQNSINQQDGATMEGGENEFYNGMVSYTLGLPKDAMSISVAANTSYNTIGTDNSLTLGPTIAVGKQFYDKKLRTNLSTSYNTSFANGQRGTQVYNIRLGGNYVWLKQHNFSFNFLALFRNTSKNNKSDFTVTFGYSYSLDNFSLDLHLRDGTVRDGVKNKETTLSFRYRNITYSGTFAELNEQLVSVSQSYQFRDIPSFKQSELKILLAKVKEQESKDRYKESALTFLDALYDYGDFQEIYNESLYAAVQKIKRDMRKIDRTLENLFVEKKIEADRHPLNQKSQIDYSVEDKELLSEYRSLLKEYKDRLEKLAGHRWMESEFYDFTSSEVVKKSIGYLGQFKKNNLVRSYRFHNKHPEPDALELYLEENIIDFYYKKSLEVVDPERLELKYINKD